MIITQNQRQSEKGNVLFLILIAVALFAALSYVVTQSTRSGGGSTDREKAILSSAQMTQYPTALRTALVRMILGGSAIENIKFNIPGNQGSISTNLLVFHPQGGGATYQDAPADLSVSGTNALAWTYNANFDVVGIGVDGIGGNDVVAFLAGVSSTVCRQVNEKLGINLSGATQTTAGIPDAPTAVTGALIDGQLMGAPFTPAATFHTTTDQPNLISSGTNAFLRQASGCFFQTDTPTRNVFYSVLLER